MGKGGGRAVWEVRKALAREIRLRCTEPGATGPSPLDTYASRRSHLVSDRNRPRDHGHPFFLPLCARGGSRTEPGGGRLGRARYGTPCSGVSDWGLICTGFRDLMGLTFSASQWGTPFQYILVGRITIFASSRYWISRGLCTVLCEG